MAARRTDLRIALVMVPILSALGCRPEAERNIGSTRLAMTLAIQETPYSGLIAVADAKGFFEKAGLDVRLTPHPSGLDSLKAMTRGEAQVATVADMPAASSGSSRGAITWCSSP